MEQSTDEPKGKKDRSPSYPFIGLKKAVERLRQLAENHKRSPARLQSVATTWGYGVKSSGLLQTVAALKQYGLIEDIGTGEDRKVQVSDLGWRYLFDEREGARMSALQEAALKPKLIAEYNAMWPMERPSDSHCISELQFDRGFTLDAARSFLKAFDETISFANLRNPDRFGAVRIEVEDQADEGNGLGATPVEQVQRTQAPIAQVPQAAKNSFQVGLRSDPWSLVVEGILTDQVRVDALIATLEAMKSMLPVDASPRTN